MTQRIVLASNNLKKLAELRALLLPVGFDLIAQGELGIAETEEPHPTFIENALAKARHASKMSGLCALADDSGLCAAALNGAPGVHSARFAGLSGFVPSSKGPDADNNSCLLAHMKDFGATERQARYVCVLAFVDHPLDPQPLIAEGEWRGEILFEARGENGFGYDPLFWLPDLGKSAAELSPEVKNARSHRSRAMQILLNRLSTRTLS